MRLSLRQQSVQIPEPAFESAAFENGGRTRGAISEIYYLASRLDRVGDGKPQVGTLLKRECARRRRCLPHLRTNKSATS